MDIKQLKFLIALEETRHFGRAALRCHITQPTFSMRIRNLEAELDLLLVNRGQRFEGFTGAGERVLAWAHTVLAAYDGLKAEAEACRGHLIGTLRIGTVAISGFDTMPLLNRIRVEHPEINFELTVLPAENILEKLGSNTLDIGVSFIDDLDTARFDVLPLAEPGLGLLHDTRCYHFDGRSLNWQQVADLPLAVMSPGSHLRAVIDHNMCSRGLSLHPLLEADEIYPLLQAVDSGLCCSLIPLNSDLARQNTHLRLIPLLDTRPLSNLGLIKRHGSNRSPLAETCFALYQSSCSGEGLRMVS
jgi:DNA-binding transcriptional LysR family regulator